MSSNDRYGNAQTIERRSRPRFRRDTDDGVCDVCGGEIRNEFGTRDCECQGIITAVGAAVIATRRRGAPSAHRPADISQHQLDVFWEHWMRGEDEHDETCSRYDIAKMQIGRLHDQVDALHRTQQRRRPSAGRAREQSSALSRPAEYSSPPPPYTQQRHRSQSPQERRLLRLPERESVRGADRERSTHRREEASDQDREATQASRRARRRRRRAENAVATPCQNCLDEGNRRSARTHLYHDCRLLTEEARQQARVRFEAGLPFQRSDQT
ncbi:hypothetical protein BDZ85DRAFT_51182 [Elsinoe ampelina]|uniref:Uncharacterized protein n=1 Tax=Elsinoe ampelina TaxID=302913 RepID=A0A6A6GL93_9PEZI|nr:hypothetical protein BDZ85DRAFT_51182 [Elsinoe ampelina]